MLALNSRCSGATMLIQPAFPRQIGDRRRDAAGMLVGFVELETKTLRAKAPDLPDAARPGRSGRVRRR